MTGRAPATESSHLALVGSSDGIVYSYWRADSFTGAATPGGSVTAGGINGTAESLVVVVRQP